MKKNTLEAKRALLNNRDLLDLVLRDLDSKKQVFIASKQMKVYYAMREKLSTAQDTYERELNRVNMSIAIQDLD